MNKQPLSEKEFEIINVIADDLRLSQRELSTHVGLSLGMTNLLLKRLATKGYLRIKQLNRKKVEYLLTARGVAEKGRKSLHYARKTLESFGFIKQGLAQILQNHAQPPVRSVLIVGVGDLAELSVLIARDLARGKFAVVHHPTLSGIRPKPDCLVLNASFQDTPFDRNNDSLNLLTELSGALAPKPSRGAT